VTHDFCDEAETADKFFMGMSFLLLAEPNGRRKNEKAQG
jgi:hypothetical protein